MAQKVITLYTSDLSGTELGEDGQSISFSIGSDQYSIDLTSKEAEKFYDTLKKYTDVATKVGGRGVRKTSVRAGGSGMTKEELANVRAWAKDNGYEVSERGRVKQEVIDAYHDAH